MKYNLNIASERRKFDIQVDYYLLKGKTVDLKEIKPTRSNKQNASLHKFFMIISEALNELGMEYIYFGLKGTEISLRYTPELVKMFFWKPIQIALFDFDSTTKLTTEQMNQVIDVIIKFFADKGVLVEFPSEDSLNKNNFDN